MLMHLSYELYYQPAQNEFTDVKLLLLLGLLLFITTQLAAQFSFSSLNTGKKKIFFPYIIFSNYHLKMKCD